MWHFQALNLIFFILFSILQGKCARIVLIFDGKLHFRCESIDQSIRSASFKPIWRHAGMYWATRYALYRSMDAEVTSAIAIFIVFLEYKDQILSNCVGDNVEVVSFGRVCKVYFYRY